MFEFIRWPVVVVSPAINHNVNQHVGYTYGASPYAQPIVTDDQINQDIEHL